ncbi:helix-turn-helix transcriptional regulator [Amycolatopsis sp. 195334CR]|uniref:helix-turn-helix domain-containing protein n=1 Tax=Amycolatopsis sp. 195334CR TaxID=2814588 RepID=UPI0027DC07AF|nr:helix-turn-helix transcriptional regulator [Amycolatopsis sp. 195334CR]
MNSPEGQPLARRLRELREGGAWPGKYITQAELAAALGTSVPSVSSWENPRTKAKPPRPKIDAYATFFATERSVAESPFRLLDRQQLTEDELARRERLLGELTALREDSPATAGPAAKDPYAESPWRFKPGEIVTIIGSELPQRLKRKMPHADPDGSDFVDLYKYADLDALVELHGHVRAANPTSDVHLRTPAELVTDDYTSHLILLGGVDWNFVTRDLLERAELPVRQLVRPEDDDLSRFEIGTGDTVQSFLPKVRREGENLLLLEDVALFYRAVNPFNAKRTVTICNGTFGRGTYGVVRALTDARFRDRNATHLRTRFAGSKEFAIISRIHVINGLVVTPDWTSPQSKLHEWPVSTT